MIFLSAQPYDPYFAWQVEVQIVNFRKFGLSNKMNILVWTLPETDFEYKYCAEALPKWKKLQEKYPEVKIFFYRDEGVRRTFYISQLRPQIIAKHFDKYPELGNETIFYHDSDIIFNYLPDFDKLSEGDINWQSDCSGYLDYNYLRSKEIQGNIPEHEAISVLAKIGKVSVDTIKEYTGKTGGAQNILKKVNGDFWRDVERQCIQIREAFLFSQPNSINKKYFKSENQGFQSWCADMWALNMALWNRGKVTDITSELDFSWATDSADTFNKKPIYHNAGATGQQNGVFYKGRFIKESPFGKEHKVRKDNASYFYVKAIQDVNNTVN